MISPVGEGEGADKNDGGKPILSENTMPPRQHLQKQYVMW